MPNASEMRSIREFDSKIRIKHNSILCKPSKILDFQIFLLSNLILFFVAICSYLWYTKVGGTIQ